MTIRSPEQVQKDIDATESELSISVANMEQLRWNAQALLQYIEQAQSLNYRLISLRNERQRAKIESERRGTIAIGYGLTAVGAIMFVLVLISIVFYPSKEGIGQSLSLSVLPLLFFAVGIAAVASAHARKPK